VVCQFLSGEISVTKLQDSIKTDEKLNSQQLKSLESLKQRIQKQISNTKSVNSLKLLLDISRFRQHLKFLRFAHRAFNRLNLLTNPHEIKLSRTAGTLYKLAVSSEMEKSRESERICHHTILKADVRGSTTVTDELANKGLNPASYFSLRFFDPINKILKTYSAKKIFIEGDAIILGFLEYERSPQQWFSVARACGYAREMLKIIGSNNRHSTQMGLPMLELGVGICYSNGAPNYLYDDGKPIMISSAIGLADRLSSCSSNVRAATQNGLFNVHVLSIAEGETDRGEKGQQFIRYNVNGILIDSVAFRKLKSEISLRSVRMKLNGDDHLFHIGQYPDTNGRKKDLIIREGKVGIWRDLKICETKDRAKSYFEVVVNRKVIRLLLDSSEKRKSITID
jgi:hypothetical protein